MVLRWNGGAWNRAAAAGLAVLLVGGVVGCGKSATPAPTTAGPGAAGAGSASPGAAAGSGSIVPGAKLAAIDLPDPHGAPPKGSWTDARPIEDGLRDANYLVGDDLWVGIAFIDCNLPRSQEEAKKPDTGEHSCVTDSQTKIKGYPVYETSDIARTMKIGHLLILTVVSGTKMDTLTVKDLEAFLASIDVAAIAAIL
jgi:hypothetical protein